VIYLLIPIILFVFYALLALVVYLFQDKFIFSPTTLSKDYVFTFDHYFEEIWITKGGLNPINALLFKVENPKGCVLYHHGNSRDLRYWASFYELFTSRGYDVLFYDYRSFGKSKGKLSEFALYSDARRVHTYLSKIYSPKNIIQYGRSLGSAIATRQASKFNPSLLILETPYLSMMAMAKKQLPFLPISLLLNYMLRLDNDIKKVKSSILMFSGTNDELTPHAHSRLLSLMNKHVNLVSLKEGTHNNLVEFDDFHQSLDLYLGPRLSNYKSSFPKIP